MSTTVTGVKAEADVRQVQLTWDLLPLSTMVDHYRIHAAQTRSSFTPSDDNLIGTTIGDIWLHSGLAVDGESWSYHVVTVDAAGRHGEPSKVVTAEVPRSVTVTGEAILTVGSFDGKTLEFHHAPDQYAEIAAQHPDGVIEVDQADDDTAAQWPYLLPGPGDAWAGRMAYALTWTFELEEVPTAPVMAIWLVDTTRLGGVLEIEVNGEPVEPRELVKGGTAGSRKGDIADPDAGLIPSYHEFTLADGLLDRGENSVVFTLAEGGWLAWDAVGVFEA